MSNVLLFQRRTNSAAIPARGDAAELAEIRARLNAAVRKFCPRWLTPDLEDLAQDAMIRVLKRQDASAQPMVFTRSYLFKVAYSTVMDEIRARNRRIEKDSIDVPDEAALGIAATERDPDVADAITDCLQTVSEDRRRALTLHLLGHSVPEAAQLLQWPAKRVENLVYRGLAALRDCLTAKGFAP